MDTQEICARAEDCLTLAQQAATRDERLYWFCKAGQWIERNQPSSKLRRAPLRRSAVHAVDVEVHRTSR